MYQIFYIDIDEEITSVIDRLKKSKTTENFFVVSPRSLILQSIVSLKLLKREAAREKKQIAMVVNDKSAGAKVEKAGILVVPSLKEFEGGGEEVRENFSLTMETKDSNNNKYKKIMEQEKNDKKSRLQGIGSDDFYKSEEVEKPSVAPPEEILASKQDFERAKPKIEAFADQPVQGMDGAFSKNIADIKKDKQAFSYIPEKNFHEEAPFSPKPEIPKEYGPNRIGNMDPYKEKLVEGFFNPGPKSPEFPRKIDEPQKKAQENVPVSHGMRKVILGFVIICLLIASLVFGYLFLPKASVTVASKSEVKKFDLEAKGSTSRTKIETAELGIPAKVVEKELTISDSFESKGRKNSTSDTSQKAKGKVTIYNNYDNDSQQLVATTRLLSSEGKLFRLVKGVAVPGMKNGEPGSIEADVIADQPGDEYNISPTDFKIPGFEGSQKYEKFYAKSTSAMSGGGSSGSGSGGTAIVSQSDLDSAKKTEEAKLKEQLEEAVKSEMGTGYVFLSDASEKTISESSSTSRANEVASSFDYKASGKIKAIVFSEKDLRQLAGDIYNEANKEKSTSDYSLIKISYGASSADFGSGTLSLKANVEVPIDVNIDWDDFKKKLLGKNEEQIKEILKEYSQIEKINIDFWPEFMSQKIPQYEKRVELKIEKNQ